MEDKDLNELITDAELTEISNDKIKDIVSQAITSNEVDNKDFTYLFNQELARRNMLRMLKLSNLLDNLSDEAVRRIQHGNVSDKALVGYINAIQKLFDTSYNQINKVSELQPQIQVQKTQTNNLVIMQNPMTPESRDKVLSFINKINQWVENNPNTDGENNNDK